MSSSLAADAVVNGWRESGSWYGSWDETMSPHVPIAGGLQEVRNQLWRLTKAKAKARAKGQDRGSAHR